MLPIGISATGQDKKGVGRGGAGQDKTGQVNYN